MITCCPVWGQRNTLDQLKISQPLLCQILKNQEHIANAAKQNENLDCKRKHVAKDGEVESALKLWFTNVRDKDVGVNGPIMLQKAEDLSEKMGKGDFGATDGWFTCWRKQNII